MSAVKRLPAALFPIALNPWTFVRLAAAVDHRGGQLADLLVLRLIGDRGVVLALAAFALLATVAADRVEAEQVRDDMGAVPPARDVRIGREARRHDRRVARAPA